MKVPAVLTRHFAFVSELADEFQELRSEKAVAEVRFCDFATRLKLDAWEQTILVMEIVAVPVPAPHVHRKET